MPNRSIHDAAPAGQARGAGALGLAETLRRSRSFGNGRAILCTLLLLGEGRGEIQISLRKLGKAAGYSGNGMAPRRGIRQLIRLGEVEVIGRGPSGRGRGGANIYRIVTTGERATA